MSQDINTISESISRIYMLPQLSIQLVQDFVDSNEKFVVKFEDIWKGLGYSAKQKAKSKLIKNFDAELDYTINRTVKRVNGNNGGGSVTCEDIRLTIGCFERLKSIAPKPKLLSEGQIRDKLAFQLKGEIEIATIAGNIDILTSTEIIEVKEVRSWKSAVGQILIYGNYYPTHSRRIHLFGFAHSQFKEMVETNCKKLDIQVTWER